MTDWAAWHRRLVEGEDLRPSERLAAALLIPVGHLYGALTAARRVLYRRGLLKRYRAPVPVISVGNLAVGGTGKTPVTDALVKSLQGRGLKVAVVSRGYGGHGLPRPGLVSRGEGPLVPARAAGDEPVLLARRNPQALVFACPRRDVAIAAAVREYGAEVVLLDDGFQHLAVERDLDIVLLDAMRPLGNGRILPAGRLREAPAALGRADLLVLTRAEAGELPALPALPARRPVVPCRYRLGDTVRALGGERRPLRELARGRAAAFAGTALPERFFADLRGQGLELVHTTAFPDHAAYDVASLSRLAAAAAAAGADFLVTTEKDGVKLRPGDLPLPCYQVPLEIAFFDPGPVERALDLCLDTERP